MQPRSRTVLTAYYLPFGLVTIGLIAVALSWFTVESPVKAVANVGPARSGATRPGRPVHNVSGPSGTALAIGINYRLCFVMRANQWCGKRRRACQALLAPLLRHQDRNGHQLDRLALLAQMGSLW